MAGILNLSFATRKPAVSRAFIARGKTYPFEISLQRTAGTLLK
jgi:hypothetical protein